MQNTRQSNMELLRIFAIILIIVHHIALHGKMVENTTGFNLFVSSFMISGGKISAQLFFMISGYYLVDRMNFPTKNLVRTVFAVWTYSVIIYSIAVGTGYSSTVSIRQFVKVLMPITSKRYWYPAAYVGMLLLSPFAVRLLNRLSFKQSLSTLVVLGLFFNFFTALQNQEPILGGNVLSALYYFLIGGYLKKYPPTMKPFTYFFLATLMYFGIALATFLNISKDILNTTDYFWKISSPLVLLCSIWILCFFITLKLPYNKVINSISVSVFGIYLLHDNPYRSFIWKDLFHVASYYKSSKLIFHFGVWFLTIFIVGLIIEKIRYYLLQRPFEKSKLFTFICDKIDSIPVVQYVNGIPEVEEPVEEDKDELDD